MYIFSDNFLNRDDTNSVYNKHFSIKCPHCNAFSNITAISIPRIEFVRRFNLKKVGISYRCNACNIPIFFRFDIIGIHENCITISDKYEEVERPTESFEFNYLPEELSNGFKEALTCFSNSCFNAFGSMCRRCVQSISTKLGAKGSDKVLRQLQDIKDMTDMDIETFDILKQIIIAGHNGAHPHLPELSPERAKILLELMKDVLYQLFVRKAKIQESIELRKNKIEQKD